MVRRCRHATAFRRASSSLVSMGMCRPQNGFHALNSPPGKRPTGTGFPGDGRKKRQSRSRQGLTYPNAQRSQPGSHQSQGLRSRRRSVSQRYMSASMTARGNAPTSPTQRTTTPGCSGVSDGRQLPAITTFVFATDRNGVVQDGTPRSVAPDGATGYHQRRVTVR